MLYKYIVINNVLYFDPYTIISRLDDIDISDLIFSKIPLLGERVATRDIEEVPTLSYPIPVTDGSTNEFNYILIKLTMLLLEIAKQNNMRKAILVFVFDKRNGVSMSWIQIKSALFKCL